MDALRRLRGLCLGGDTNKNARDERNDTGHTGLRHFGLTSVKRHWMMRRVVRIIQLSVRADYYSVQKTKHERHNSLARDGRSHVSARS